MTRIRIQQLFLGFIAFFFLLSVAFPLTARVKFQFLADHMVLEAVTDNRYVFAATQNGRINCFNLKNRNREKDLIRLKGKNSTHYPPVVYSLSISPDLKRLAASTGTGEVLLFSTRSRLLIKRISVKDVENILVVRFLDNDNVVVGLMDGSIRRIQLSTGSEIFRQKIELDPVNNIQLSENRQIMAVTTAASSIKIVDTETGKIQKVLIGHKDIVYGLAFLGNDTLLTGSKDKTLLKWNLRTGSFQLLYKSDFYINSVAWNSKDTSAFHLPDYKIGLMQSTSNKIINVLEGHRSFINTLYFITPNQLLSSGNDARVIIHSL